MSDLCNICNNLLNPNFNILKSTGISPSTIKTDQDSSCLRRLAPPDITAISSWNERLHWWVVIFFSFWRKVIWAIANYVFALYPFQFLQTMTGRRKPETCRVLGRVLPARFGEKHLEIQRPSFASLRFTGAQLIGWNFVFFSLQNNSWTPLNVSLFFFYSMAAFR